jgi:hypothetical protein
MQLTESTDFAYIQPIHVCPLQDANQGQSRIADLHRSTATP